MSFKNISIETIGLHVGGSKWNVPDQAILSKAGTFTCSGMSIFGDCSDRGGVATVTIGTADEDSLQKNMKLSLNVKGNSVLQGDSQTPYALHVSGGRSVNSVYIDGDLYVSGSTDTALKGRLAAANNLAKALPPKSFDIEHPIKGKGWRLRYVCLEGPEAAVYCRGRLKESNVINLPDHWKGLVHEDSISVQLQPIGDIHLHLNVVSFDNEKIVIKEADDKSIDCFYHVHGERKDVNPVLVEYEGNSRYDYPDPNLNEESGMALEDRNFRDPNYLYPRNTITS